MNQIPPESTGPLTGWDVLLPRPADQADGLSVLLRAVGAQPISVPLIEIVPPEDPAPFDVRLLELAQGEFSWVGFTSVNAVNAVLKRATALGLSPAVPANTRVAAVGPATAVALRNAGLPVHLVPTGPGSGAALADIWPGGHAGDSVLLPRSDIARPGLPQALAANGYLVQTVIAYRTAIRTLPTSTAAELTAGRFDAILLTSPSTVTALADVVIAGTTVLGTIGESTAQAVIAAGHQVHFVAATPTNQSLVAGLEAAATARSRTPAICLPHSTPPNASRHE